MIAALEKVFRTALLISYQNINDICLINEAICVVIFVCLLICISEHQPTKSLSVEMYQIIPQRSAVKTFNGINRVPIT